MNSAMTLRNVHAYYGDSHVLHDVSFAVGEHEVSFRYPPLPEAGGADS